MSEEFNIVETESIEPSFYNKMPFIADDELDPYQYRLYGHYRRLSEFSGRAYESNKTTADKCKISERKLIEIRNELEQLGYIKLDRTHKRPDGGQGTVRVILVNIWKQNRDKYQKNDGEGAGGATGRVQEVQPPVAGGATKEESFIKEELNIKETLGAPKSSRHKLAAMYEVGKPTANEDEKKTSDFTALERVILGECNLPSMTYRQSNMLDEKLPVYDPFEKLTLSLTANELYVRFPAYPEWIKQIVSIKMDKQRHQKSGKIGLDKFIKAVKSTTQFTEWWKQNPLKNEVAPDDATWDDFEAGE